MFPISRNYFKQFSSKTFNNITCTINVKKYQETQKTEIKVHAIRWRMRFLHLILENVIHSALFYYRISHGFIVFPIKQEKKKKFRPNIIFICLVLMNKKLIVSRSLSLSKNIQDVIYFFVFSCFFMNGKIYFYVYSSYLLLENL